jgi:Rrf2 family protein
MKLSTKARYAVRFMIDLATHSDRGYIPLKEIADREEISWKYLWNLIGPLKSAGLINVARGSQGGYKLGKPVDQINLKDIVYAVEGSLCLVDCVDSPSLCKKSNNCITRQIWSETSSKIQEYLKSITLDDVINKYGKNI